MKRLALALALLVAGAAAATLLGVGTAGAGSPSSVQTVREQNVDPQGDIKVHEQGTPSVSLTGSPEVGLDPTLGNTVKIDPNGNTVKIDPTTAPVPTMAADNPAFDPVGTHSSHALNPGDNATPNFSIYTVPTGHELVIEQVSFDALVPVDQQISFASIETSVGGSLPVFAIPATSVADPTVNGVYSVGDIQTRLYADPGTSVDCFAVRTSTLGQGSVSCSISGYLVPVK